MFEQLLEPLHRHFDFRPEFVVAGSFPSLHDLQFVRIDLTGEAPVASEAATRSAQRMRMALEPVSENDVKLLAAGFFELIHSSFRDLGLVHAEEVQLWEVGSVFKEL